MRILLAQDHCSLGGHTYLRMEVARGLVARGHEVFAFFFEDLGCLEGFRTACPCSVGTAADLGRLLRARSFDIVHGDASMQDLVAITRRAGFRGRLVITRHHVDSMVGWLSGNCDVYSAESASSAALMAPYTDLPVDLLPNGVDVEFFRPLPPNPSDRPIIAWCGRSRSTFKNVSQYLRVTRLLDPTRYRFWVADGSAPMDSPVADWGDISHVEVWRCFSRDEFPQFFSDVASSGGCLLTTSLMEGLPMTLIEALSCECPVIARNSRGVSDVLTGDLAEWLFPPETPDDLRVKETRGSAANRPGTSGVAGGSLHRWEPILSPGSLSPSRRVPVKPEGSHRFVIGTGKPSGCGRFHSGSGTLAIEAAITGAPPYGAR